jgi:DNA-binding transcriptional ArsR family regulator
MLETVFGNKTAQLIFLRLYREDEISAGQLAKDFGKSITGFQNQLEKFEDAGLLVSRKIGQVRLFSFNPQSSFVGPLKNLIKIEYEKLGPKGIEYIFSRRMRPRKRGKEILGDKDV